MSEIVNNKKKYISLSYYYNQIKLIFLIYKYEINNKYYIIIFIYPPINITNNSNLFTEQDSNTILHF